MNFDFSVTADANSSASNRFMIVFKGTAAPLPVTFTSIKAYQQAANVNVEWKVSGELNISKYEILKSTDGLNFSLAGTQQALGNNSSDMIYNWVDVNPVAGDNFYRVRSIGIDGSMKYTTIVKVTIGKQVKTITVYPNPVTDKIVSIQFTAMDKGVYSLRLINSLGQVVLTQSVAHAGGSATQTVQVGNVAKGSYHLEIVQPDRSKVVKNLVIE
jgi:hypothetical protein